MGLGTWELRLRPKGARAKGARTRGATAAGATARRGDLAQRAVFGFAIGVPVLAGAALGGPWFLLGAALLGALGLREFFALATRAGARLVPALGYLLGLALLLANGGLDLLGAGAGPRPAWAPPVLWPTWTPPDPGTVALLTRLAVAAVVVVPLVALLFDRRDSAATGSGTAAGATGVTGATPGSGQARLTGWALTVAGTLYVAWLLSHFQTLRLLGGAGAEVGRGWVFFVFAATWSYDTGAYLVGRRFGRHRFMTWISPRKTWEGAAGGLAGCLLVTLVARSPAPAALATLTGWAPLPIPLWHVPLLALAVCAAAQLGDLAESLIKREAGAKDASALIPGHGGMLDRMDSLLFTVLLVYYYAVLVLGIR